jgi:NAD(P)-dependent dehydrogenase (short-subunit alcohol dehydrogenase family)
MKFEGKSVLVTSGSSGMGKAAAEMFGREGAKVAIGYLESLEKMRVSAEELAAKIRDDGGEAIAFPLTLRKKSPCGLWYGRLRMRLEPLIFCSTARACSTGMF